MFKDHQCKREQVFLPRGRFVCSSFSFRKFEDPTTADSDMFAKRLSYTLLGYVVLS